MRPLGERHRRHPRGIPQSAQWVFFERRESQARRGAQEADCRYWYEPNDIADRRKQRVHARRSDRTACHEDES